MSNSIEITGLSKSFTSHASGWGAKRQTKALDDIHLAVADGECYALIGPNGAGKTTLIKILTSLIIPDSGTARIARYDLKSQPNLIKSKVGIVTGDERSFYWRLTGRQNLEFFASLYDVTPSMVGIRIDKLVEMLDLGGNIDKRFQELSSGTKQKIALIRALIHDPEVLFIDELTRGLDPSVSQHLKRFIKEAFLSQEHKSVFFTTHHTSEVENFADRIAIIDNGRIRARGTLESLKKEAGLPRGSLLEIFLKMTGGR